MPPFLVTQTASGGSVFSAKKGSILVDNLHLRTALQGVREAKGCLELLARLQGELQERTTVNVLINPQWLTLRTVILQALDEYPEARFAVAQALQEVEGNAGR